MKGPANSSDRSRVVRPSFRRVQGRWAAFGDGTAAVVVVAVIVAVMACVSAGGCVGTRFQTSDPGTATLDGPTRTIVDLVTTQRRAANLTEPTLVAELRPVAVRAALGVARGEVSLKTAAHAAAQDGVTESGRHTWTFATECTDLKRFRAPLLVLQQKTLLWGVAAVAVPGQAGRLVVLLVVVEPGTSSLRADRMGGGPGGTNPSAAVYGHPSVATAPCGETWPASPRGTF